MCARPPSLGLVQSMAAGLVMDAARHGLRHSRPNKRMVAGISYSRMLHSVTCKNTLEKVLLACADTSEEKRR